MPVKTIIIVFINLFVIGLFIFLWRKKNLLVYFTGGRWWLTWLSVGVITLMDELTSIFYAPAEGYIFIGIEAIFYIAFVSLLMRFLSTRMVEIAEILDHHKIKGGGVYSFSYFVLGPSMSFIAVASILVDYILTASISTVSAVKNGTAFVPLTSSEEILVELCVVWGIALLNILGIKENARFTFMIFTVAAVIFANLIASGIFNLDHRALQVMGESFAKAGENIVRKDPFTAYSHMIAGISSVILAYSGIESVLQTAGLTRSWRDISKAYIFLALTVGIVTPLVSALALSAPFDLRAHSGDLIAYYAFTLNGVWFGVIVGFLASATLIMAVNTAFVAMSELIERVADRYGFHWLTKPNSRQSLYRIHIGAASFFSFLILVTRGNQTILAEMYALGLLAAFSINIASLLIYRYFLGTKEIREYNTSRVGTLLLFIILLSSFIYLLIHKPYGRLLWGGVTLFLLLVGVVFAKRRAPEQKEIQKTDSPMDIVFALADSGADQYHIYFKRPAEGIEQLQPGSVYVSFYSPREGIPARLNSSHFRFPYQRATLFNRILAILYMLQYEFPDKQITVHLGWPTSSWLDRLSIGAMVFSLMRLPRYFPHFNFVIEYFRPLSRTVLAQPELPIAKQ